MEDLDITGESDGERGKRSSCERAFDQAVVSPRSSAQRWDGIINDGMQMKSNRLFGDRQKEREKVRQLLIVANNRRLLAKAPSSLETTETDERRKRDLKGRKYCHRRQLNRFKK